MVTSFDTFTTVWAEVRPLVRPDAANDARDCLFDVVLKYRDLPDQDALHQAVLAHFKKQWVRA